MAKNTRNPEDHSAEELNREEADAMGAPPLEALPEEAVPVEAPAALVLPEPVADFFNEFEAEKVKLTAACKAWIRKELELFGLGHSAQDRAERNP